MIKKLDKDKVVLTGNEDAELLIDKLNEIIDVINKLQPLDTSGFDEGINWKKKPK
jgi:Asp-tRNA(Asn)/Glu-tRNA(Gln) amidotransferase C subunit